MKMTTAERRLREVRHDLKEHVNMTRSCFEIYAKRLAKVEAGIDITLKDEIQTRTNEVLDLQKRLQILETKVFNPPVKIEPTPTWLDRIFKRVFGD